jgi:hypothetical protein
MYYRCIPEPLPPPTRAAAPFPEGSRSRAVKAFAMLCVPLVSFGFVLALYLVLTA